MDIWGAELWTLEGRLGFPRSRRASLMYAALLCVGGGASGRTLEQALGGLCFACAFRREVLSCLSAVYAAVRSLPQRRCCKIDGRLADELVVVSFAVLLRARNC